MFTKDENDAVASWGDDFRAALKAIREMPPRPPPVILIHSSPYLSPGREQFRFPRSKRCRIRKKWRKDPRNWRSVANIVRGVDGSMTVDPETFETMRDEFLPRIDAAFTMLPGLAGAVSAGLDIKTPKIAEQAFPSLRGPEAPRSES